MVQSLHPAAIPWGVAITNGLGKRLVVTQLNGDGQPVGEPVVIDLKPDAERFDFAILEPVAKSDDDWTDLADQLHVPAEQVRVPGRDEHRRPVWDDPNGA
jgi:hypothetical protein